MKSLLFAIIPCFFIVHAFSQVNLNQGLIGYFPFNGDANDRSGNGNNPTFNNGTLAPDRFGNPNQAYWFDGVNGGMTIPGAAGLNTANAMSIALYFNPETTNLATLVGKINYALGNGTQFQVAINWNTYPGVLFGVNNPTDDCNSQIVQNSSYVYTGSSPLTTNVWYCLAATFVGGVQKIYLNGTLIQTTNAPFTTLKQCNNSDIQIGTWWQNDQQRYKGRIDDVRIYNRALTQDEVTALCNACSNPVSDFNFKQEVCNPLAVQFTSVGNNLLDPVWDFGDGTTASGNLNPVHTYANTGNYTVKLNVQNANCKDAITKNASVNIIKDDIVLTPDTTICIGATAQLRAKPALSYCWSPTTNLNNPNIATPVTSTPTNTTYYLTSEVPNGNLVVNGDFNNGGTGFTSAYTWSTSGVPEGTYFVSNNPPGWHPAMPNCKDHTGSTGNGNMLLVNGATTANVPVWSQTINITPNTNYAFSAWLQHMTSLNPARLQFSINGTPIGNIFQANNVNCIWDQFYTVWNSGNNTTATISIINQNTILSGNDFALDDIQFSELMIVRDSVKVTVAAKPVVNLGPDISDCQVNNLVLDAGNAGSQYLWQNGSTAQTFTANSFGKYYVKVTDANGCVNSDTITITQTLLDNPDFSFKQDVCNPLAVQFTAIGTNLAGAVWDFGDGTPTTGTLNPVHSYANAGNYSVKLSVQNGNCNKFITKSISVNIINDDIVLTPDTTICSGTMATLRAKPALSYCWSPTTNLNNPNIANPVTSTPTNTTYYLTSEVPKGNLVVNGDFNNGGTGFTSAYTWSTSGVNEGTYFVSNNPPGWHPAMPNCKDHTGSTGNGNMLLVNGATTANVPVWSQTINITPNTNYAFSAWLQHMTSLNPARLQFSINGTPIGNIFQANNVNCIWDQFYTVWNSGNNTTATISIINQNTILSGNDFALDDIQFSELTIVRDSVKVNVQPCLACTNWLSLPSYQSYMDVGDLDIPGNTITVEAMINRTAPWTGGNLYAGDVVSKHIDPSDANYLLRPNSAEVTTNNGYFKTPDICPIDLNKTYHVAMVYDGAMLKFYRDGFLMSQVPATGNLVQNNWHTSIGLFSALTLNTQLVGYVNEVRIWNVARSQAQIRQYMNASLPSPATQPGLQAYYTFDNLLNKQGNSAWNGKLGGSAALNSTNPNCAFTPDSCNLAVVQFTAPDTVCLNTPVNITNTSSGATSYYWNFCVADINQPPVAVNIGNPGSLATPTFLDYVYTNNNYYAFVTNYTTGNLVRLDFGNSLLNTPTSVNLGNYGGILQTNSVIEGIQVVQNEGRWYAIIVGGNSNANTEPRIVKIDFGANITSQGTATSWGNVGNMNQPVDLHMFKEGNNWYGFTVSAETNSIIRFNFTNSFNNTPTAINMGNIGGLSYPTGIYAINDNGFWRVFITNGGDNTRVGPNSSITRLDFGNSLLNTPTAVNLGNPGGNLHHPRDLTIMKFCGQVIGFAVNGNPSYNNLVRLNFNNDLTTAPVITSLGNTGNYNFPHSISRLFRANDDVYAFITNVGNSTVTRLRFPGCTNASVSSSTLKDPPSITYSTPGTYNINLTIDDGLPTQASICKQVVVLAPPVHTPTQALSICANDSIRIGTGVKNAIYTWNTGAATDSVTVKTAGTYWVQTDVFGCSNKDSMEVTVNPAPTVNLGADYSDCAVNNVVLDAGNAGSSYLWQDGSTAQTFTANGFGKYYVRVTNVNGCSNADTITITLQTTSASDFSYKQDVCNPLAVQFTGLGSNLTNPYWNFGDGNTTTGNLNTSHTYAAYGDYTVQFGVETGACKDTITKTISINVTDSNIIYTPDTTICFNGTGQLHAAPALSFCWSPATYLDNPNSSNPVTATPGTMTYYYTAEVPGTNLVNNGDFSSGNTGFNSSYNYTAQNVVEEEFSVGYNPQSWNPLLGTCTDHTGNGQMMLVNGAPRPNVVVWIEKINVTPNTNYAFSAWLQNINVNNAGSNPPQLQFSINGNLVGNILQGRNDMCVWDQFYTVWNSGNNTTASIAIINQNTVAAGNDFALDDISFAPLMILRDSVKVMVDTPVVKAGNDTTTCKLSPVPLQASGAATWSWSPLAGLSDSTISNPIATPLTGTQYIVTGTDTYGCAAKDTVQINLFPDLVVDLGPDMTDCAVNNLVLDAGNAGSIYVWQDGSTAQTYTANDFGKYYVQVTSANGCVNADTIVVSKTLNRLGDFTYTIDACNPLSVQFTGIGSNLQNPNWNFGDGNTSAGNFNPSHTYASYGDYMVQFAMESGYCKDTITKNIAIQVTTSDLIYTPDTTICFNGTGQLRAAPALSFCWSPATYLDNPNISNPVTSTPGNITYYYTAEVPGTNLVVNGDFSNGNTSFSSDYQYNSSGLNPAVYYVGTNPSTWNPGMTACHDHTTGAGNMLLVNGSQQTNVKVWSQTVTVTPNTNYAFSAWLQHITTVNPAKLQFSINGNVIGNVFQANSTSCIWDQFYTAWNSGNNTTATLSIVNQNTGFSGNDFALDDISFAPLMILRDSIKVTVDTPLVKTNNDTTICTAGFVQLQATGAATWSWSPAAGLSNINTGNPVATPAVNTDYIVTGTTLNGCSAKDTVSIALFPVPTVITDHDLTACPNTPVQLAANPGLTSWNWSPAGSLNNPAIANPVATADQNIQYHVQVTDANNCSYSDSVNVQLLFTDFKLSTKGGAICKGGSVNLIASGGDSYLWSPAGSLDNAALSAPMATPDTSTLYSVHVTENTCNTDTTMQVLVTVNPSPTVVAEKSNDLDCITHSAQLNATGSPGNAYLWSPVTGLNRPYSPNPVSTTEETITYVVAATNQFGCVALDSVTVLVTSTGRVSFEVPNAFTPNGDGRNDCLGVKSWGGVELEEFSIFNRWGQRVFSSTKTNPCWDGRFHGELQPSGGYVYVIKAKTYCGPIKRTGTVILIR